MELCTDTQEMAKQWQAKKRLEAAASAMYQKLTDTVDWLDREIETRTYTAAVLRSAPDISHLEELRDDLAETLRKIDGGS
jgi:hypothetical protein